MASRQPWTEEPLSEAAWSVVLEEMNCLRKVVETRKMMSERQPTAALDAEDGWRWMVGACVCVCVKQKLQLFP